MRTINDPRKRSRGFTYLIIGSLGFFVFGCLNSITIPSFNFRTHEPIGGSGTLKCPILLGKNERARIRASIKNPKDYSLVYKISIIQDRYTSEEKILDQWSAAIPALGTKTIQYPIIGETTGDFEIQVEAISSEDPTWSETGGGYYLPIWKSSFKWGCMIQSTGVPVAFNLILRIAFCIAVVMCILGLYILFAPRLMGLRKDRTRVNNVTGERDVK